MSTAVTSFVPSTADGTALNVLRMPSSAALSIAALGPTSIISWAYTVFTEWTVASTRLVRPSASLSE